MDCLEKLTRADMDVLCMIVGFSMVAPAPDMPKPNSLIQALVHPESEIEKSINRLVENNLIELKHDENKEVVAAPHAKFENFIVTKVLQTHSRN